MGERIRQLKWWFYGGMSVSGLMVIVPGMASAQTGEQWPSYVFMWYV